MFKGRRQHLSFIFSSKIHFVLPILYLALQHNIASAGDTSGSGNSPSYRNNESLTSQQQLVQNYKQEALCALNNATKKNPSAEQVERAEHFAETFAQLTFNWDPPLTDNARRHIYAQLAVETSMFKFHEELGGGKMSKIPSGKKYRGRGWVQLTHRENYRKYACFKKNLGSELGQNLTRENVEEMSAASPTCFDHDGIVFTPHIAFDPKTDEGKTNMDLSTLWYFIQKMKSDQKFKEALDTASAEAVTAIRKGVNLGSSTAKGEPNGLKEAQDAFQGTDHCFGENRFEWR